MKYVFYLMFTIGLLLSYFLVVEDEYIIQRRVSLSNFVENGQRKEWSNIDTIIKDLDSDRYRAFEGIDIVIPDEVIKNVKIWKSYDRKEIYMSSSGLYAGLHREVLDLISLYILGSQLQIYNERFETCSNNCVAHKAEMTGTEYKNLKFEKRMKLTLIFFIFNLLFNFFFVRESLLNRS